MRPRVALTIWRRQSKGQLRIRKECDREWHSQTGDGIVRDKSGYGKNVTESGTHQLETGSRDKSGYGKNATESGTHNLESASKGTNQDTERMRPRVLLTFWRRNREGQVRIRKECNREWHSLPGDGIVRDTSGYGMNATESGTHFLETGS